MLLPDTKDFPGTLHPFSRILSMEKHVHSILAKYFQRKKRKTHKPITNKNTHKHRQVTLHTNEKGRQDPGCPALRTEAVG